MKILSPLTGFIVPISQVPDAVFSQKMVGDGLAIESIDSILYSPIDGKIEFIHPSKHAITIKSIHNIEVLIHIGIDTVSLKGQGFKTFVQPGQSVRAGDKLIEFDLDFVLMNAKSAMTIILITQNQNYNLNFFDLDKNISIAKKTFLFEVTNAGKDFKSNTTTAFVENLAASDRITCMIETGLHARPAAAITQIAKKYQSEINIFKKNSFANAKSMTSILALSVAHLDEIIIEATGVDARNAVTELTDFIKNMKEEKHTSQASTQAHKKNKTAVANEFHGVMASPGQVYGSIFQLRSDSLVVTKKDFNNISAVENKKLTAALDITKVDLQRSINNLPAAEKDQRGIFQAHLELLNDPEVINRSTRLIEQGSSAEYAWFEGINQLKDVFQKLDNEVMAGRAQDLHDVGQRVLRQLLGKEKENPLANLPKNKNIILIARSLNPSDMATFDPQTIKGLCLVEGGASSHVAIMARSMGIASIAAVDESILELKDDTEALLYASRGYLNSRPKNEEIDKIKIEIENQDLKNKENLKTAQEIATTLDGHRIEVFANIGKHTEALDALKNGAEGVGLLRSEFLFLDRTSEPSEIEQQQKYQEIISALNNQKNIRPVIIRTLDVGGDKPLSYLPMPHEENPFLGVRGLRLSLKSSEMFRTQLKSLLKVQPLSALKIMFPMVTTLSELLQAKEILNEESKKLNVTNISVGIMIEVPSAALLAEQFAPHVDFFSIGSNDLTQYTLAIDRGHRELAAMADGLHPSVLHLIKITCDAAKKYKKYVGVCGGIASDAHAIPLLIGLGVDELSVSVLTIPNVKAQIRRLQKAECIALAEKSLQLAEANQVRELVQHLI